MMDFEATLSRLREHFDSGATRPLAARLDSLRALERWLEHNEDAVLAALHEDLGKSACEAYLTEVAMIRQELRHARKHLPKWVKPQRARTALGQMPGACRVYSEPYGVALVMSPWNYPFQLSVAPLIGALCAGNCALLKPSAYAPATSALLERMARETFAPGLVTVVQGGRQENAALLEQRFDFLFFTGSPQVGRLVMEKAAAHLTPVSLELGGKSPVIVERTADVALAARRIVWGKFLNAGQTCVAPDYVLVETRLEQSLIDALVAQIRAQHTSAPLANPDYPKIVNERHFDRLEGLMQSGVVLHGGQTDRRSLRIAPTLLTDVAWDSPVMSEEIFGPLLPILTVDSLDEAIRRIRQRPKPLALYLFTRDREAQRRVLEQVSFGGGCINDTVMHLATPYMPFGGVGESGMGRYHGKDGFDTFSHRKSVLCRGARPDVPLRYAPYGEKRLKTVRRLL